MNKKTSKKLLLEACYTPLENSRQNRKLIKELLFSAYYPKPEDSKEVKRTKMEVLTKALGYSSPRVTTVIASKLGYTTKIPHWTEEEVEKLLKGENPRGATNAWHKRKRILKQLGY